MAKNSALWADLVHDLDAAQWNADQASMRAKMLEASGAELEAIARSDREYAIALLLHHCYSAMEAALERLILEFDETLPRGADHHREVLRRASRPFEDARSAIITADTAHQLGKLRSFRHVVRHAYDDYDYDKAAENVPLAAALVQRFRVEVIGFAEQTGIKTSD